LNAVRLIDCFFIVLQSSCAAFAFNYEEFRLQFNNGSPVADLELIQHMASDGLVGRQIVVQAEDQTPWYVALIETPWRPKF